MRWRGRATPAGSTAVRSRPGALASCLFVLLFAAGLWIETGSAAPNASPDPHPSATAGDAPAPDPYEAPARSQPETRVVETPSTPSSSTTTPTYTPPDSRTTIQQASAPTRTTEKPKQRTAARTSPTRTQAKQTKQTKQTKPQSSGKSANAVAAPRRTAPARIVAASAEGGPLLLGGLGLVALALASGSLLFLVNRSGGWETRS